MQAIGVDLYNQCITGDIAKTMNAIKSDADHVPCVITITMNTYQAVNDDGIIPSLLASDSHRGGGIAIVISECDGLINGKRIQQAGHTRCAE